MCATMALYVAAHLISLFQIKAVTLNLTLRVSSGVAMPHSMNSPQLHYSHTEYSGSFSRGEQLFHFLLHLRL